MRSTRVTNSLRRLRFERGEMTQAELAERVWATRLRVVTIAQGQYSPSLEVAFQIAHVLNGSLEDVFQYPQPEGEPS